jgi:hypothetical protein
LALLCIIFADRKSTIMTAKKIIIPIGFNAEQCKRGVLAYFADDITTEWMADQDFVQQYLYCQEDGDYDPPLEVWLLVWDSPGKTLQSPRGTCSSLGIVCRAVSINLTWCKVHHKGLTVHVIKVLAPEFGSRIPVIEDSWFGNVVDHFHTVDYQKELDLTDGNLPFGNFLIKMDEKIAEIIKNKPQTEKDEKES